MKDTTKLFFYFVLLITIFASVTAATPDIFAGTKSSQAQPAKFKEGVNAAYFAGGCFWCVEQAFEKVKGVHDAVSGYTGGQEKDPDYDQVASGRTNHYEAVKVLYNPKKVSYTQLLATFWKTIDPHDRGGQFCDRGAQYKAAIFPRNDRERTLAQRSRKALSKSGELNDPIVTDIQMAGPFYPADQKHQAYYKKHSVRYSFYKTSCGRERRLNEVWKGIDVLEILENAPGQE